MDETDKGVVPGGHPARANPQCANSRKADKTLAIFQGPQAYVTLSWYAAKAKHGRVVPAWKHAMVQVRILDAPDRLAPQVTRLTDRHASRRAHPRAVTVAPDAFVAVQLRTIVGIEIPVAAIAGKWKMSQNRSEADWCGVAEGLRTEGDPGAGRIW